MKPLCSFLSVGKMLCWCSMLALCSLGSTPCGHWALRWCCISEGLNQGMLSWSDMFASWLDIVGFQLVTKFIMETIMSLVVHAGPLEAAHPAARGCSRRICGLVLLWLAQGYAALNKDGWRSAILTSSGLEFVTHHGDADTTSYRGSDMLLLTLCCRDHLSGWRTTPGSTTATQHSVCNMYAAQSWCAHYADSLPRPKSTGCE